MNKEEIYRQLKQTVAEANIYLDEPMSKHTSFKVGGPADVLLSPKSAQAVSQTAAWAHDNNIALTVLGNCSNVLVKDKGIRGIVLKVGGGLTQMTVQEDFLHCGAGVMLSTAANTACQAGLTGLEFAAGIPGSVGGGVFMNAGAYEGELKDVVVEVTSVDAQGLVRVRTSEQLQFAYRHSIFSDNGEIIICASLRLRTGDQEQIRARMADFAYRRTSKQPLELPSAGSTFKRPQGHFAGKLIQDAGLCGLTIGGAQVSEKHAGFIVNVGKATAADILALIQTVQDKVKQDFGVQLQPEVKIIGE